jgi:hypothetical protein
MPTDDRTTDSQIQEIRERYDYAKQEWHPIRVEAKKDMLCVAGKVWQALDPKGLKARDDAKRPHLDLDEVGQYLNQAINDVRGNPRSIKFSPTGNGATDSSAEFYGNKTREIEYRSKAAMVYTTAFENAIQRSYGFARVMTKREHARTLNQDLWIAPFMNPDLVTPDPDAVMPDSSDIRYCFIEESRTIEEFRRQFPRAKQVDFDGEARRDAPSWFKDNRIVLAEYWKIKTRQRTLVILKDGKGIFEDEINGREIKAADIFTSEEVQDQSVYQCLTNGFEILEETPWMGRYIPIASCYGKVLYLDEGAGTKRHMVSMVRLARDPQMLYNYIRTCEVEAIGGVPRATWLGYKGQFAGLEENWERANREPVAYLEAQPTTERTGAQILPLPVKLPWDPPLQNLEIAAEAGAAGDSGRDGDVVLADPGPATQREIR